MAARFGYTADLSPAERKKMISFNRSMRRGIVIDRAKRTTKSFVERNGPLILCATAAIVVLYFRKELKETIGGQPRHLLTP